MDAEERIPDQFNMLNLGLKGKQNVDACNKHMLCISKIDPRSYVNKKTVLRWIRKNKVQVDGVAIWITINVAYVAVLIIDDKGSFRESIQIAFGEIVGAELGAFIGAQIGAAIGTIVPVWGNIIIGFISSFIGALIGGGIVQLKKLARYLFCVAPASPGPGVPILDTDPYPTYTGFPDQGLDDNVYGVPGEEYDTGAFGIPSMGLDTGAFGTPESDYKTRRM